jgi:hypothetical protein
MPSKGLSALNFAVNITDIATYMKMEAINEN